MAGHTDDHNRFLRVRLLEIFYHVSHLGPVRQPFGRQIRRGGMLEKRLRRHVPGAGVRSQAGNLVDPGHICEIGNEYAEEATQATRRIFMRRQQSLHVAIQVIDGCNTRGESALDADILGHMTGKRYSQFICGIGDGSKLVAREPGVNLEEIVAGGVLLPHHRRGLPRTADAVAIE